jgi:Na+/H+ antiporter NhaC
MGKLAFRLVIALVLLAALPALASAAQAPEAQAFSLSVKGDGAQLAGKVLHLRVTAEGLPPGETASARVLLDGRDVTPEGGLVLHGGEQPIALPGVPVPGGRRTIAVNAISETGASASAETDLWAVPGWLSIVPPLLAIALALIFKEVLLALFAGVYAGAMILAGWNPIAAFARTGDQFIVQALAEPDHVKIIIFSTVLGAMVGVISKSGGTHGIVERLSPYATTPRRGQIATWLMGILIFFDDYANTLIVGSTMRPITDRLKISREKLAYIVDSTAAPVASLIPISTWVGFEVGLIAGAFTTLGLDFNPYGVFVASIPYRFYPLFALVLGFTIAISRRDLGPMRKAEQRAALTGAVIADGDIPLADYTQGGLMPRDEVPKRALNAFVPIATVVIVTLAGLFVSGSAQISRADYPTFFKWFQDVLSNASSYDTLIWASLAGLLTAIALPVVQRIIPLKEALEGMLEGFKAMMLAVIVLVLAWSIAEVCGQLHTTDFIVGISEGVLSPHLLPALVFVISAAIAFATGSSWSTMAILMPLVISLAHGLAIAAGYGPETPTFYTLMVGTVSSVLAGSVWGDHCSPISDTTILSSMASGCDHIAHVRTQLPYALTIGVLGMAVGDIPTAYGLPAWVSLLVGSAVIIVVVLWLGRRPESDVPAQKPAKHRQESIP